MEHVVECLDSLGTEASGRRQARREAYGTDGEIYTEIRKKLILVFFCMDIADAIYADGDHMAGCEGSGQT